MIGNAYYWNDRYYPVSYYTNNNRRYYRPDFNRPSMYHPNARYRHLNAAQINHWKHNQASSFDPQYRPTPPHIQRPNQNRPNVRPNNGRPNTQQVRPNQPQVNQQRPQVNQNRPQLTRPTVQQRPNAQQNRPAPQKMGPNLNAAQRQEIMRQTQQNRQIQYQQNRQAREFQNRRMNER